VVVALLKADLERALLIQLLLVNQDRDLVINLQRPNPVEGVDPKLLPEFYPKEGPQIR